MSVRKEVQDFVALGPLPDESAHEDVIAAHQVLMAKIKRPVTNDEAALLINGFGPDDCYGLAWSLLHLIETAPSGAPLNQRPGDTENEWLRLLGFLTTRSSTT